MNIKEVYKRFEHLDPILSLPTKHGVSEPTIKDIMLYEFWQAIKAEARGEE